METCTAADVDTYDLDYAIALVADRLKDAAEKEASPMRTNTLRRHFTDLGSLLSQMPT